MTVDTQRKNNQFILGAIPDSSLLTCTHDCTHTHTHPFTGTIAHAHTQTRTCTRQLWYLTQCQSKPKCEEVAGSWTQQSLCRAPHLSATRFQTHQALACLLVCLLFFFFCAMVGVTCQNRKLLRWTPHCAHPIVPFSSLPVVLFAWAWNAEQPRFASYCCAEQSRKGKQPALESNASSPSTATSIITSTTDSTCFI